MTGFIIAGTDTGVGKTVVAAGLALALGATYWKPVQAGLDGFSDSQMARRLGVGSDRIHPEAYRLSAPLSPHRAAEVDGIVIDESRLALPSCKRIVVETAGGVLVPLRRDLSQADMIRSWGLPVVVVARTSLGTINHTLLTVEALRRREIAIAGIVFCGVHEADSEATIVALSGAVHLGRLPHLEPLDATTLAQAVRRGINLGALT